MRTKQQTVKSMDEATVDTSPFESTEPSFKESRVSMIESSLLEALRQRMTNPEDKFNERKLEGVSTEDIRKTLVAFANTLQEGETAILFIGVADDGALIGVTDSDKMQKEIRRTAEQKCYPPITSLSCAVINESGKDIIAVVVNPSDNKPHFAGIAYIRKGSESVQAPSEIFEDLIASRNDKARRILREKGKLITVRKEEPRNVGKLSDGSFWRKMECRVVDCTGHYVGLHSLLTDKLIHASLEQVTISFDAENNRLLLYIKATY